MEPLSHRESDDEVSRSAEQTRWFMATQHSWRFTVRWWGGHMLAFACLVGMLGSAAQSEPAPVIDLSWKSAAKAGDIHPVQAVEPKPIEQIMPPKDAGGEELKRLPALGNPVGLTPKVTKEVKERFGQFVTNVVDPENTLDLIHNRSRLMLFKDAPKRVQIADEKIASSTVISPQELSLTGNRVGTTVMTLWFADPKNKDKQVILSYLVRVLPDPELKGRTERVYAALAQEINKAFPDSEVRIKLVGDKLVLMGEVKDIQEGFQILRIVRANAPRDSAATIPINQLNVIVPAEAVADADVMGEHTLENFLVAGGRNVINQLRVAGEQQVMLRCTIAEVNRSAARSIGINFSVANSSGLVFAQLTGGLLGLQANGAGFGGGGGSVSTSGINLPARLDGGNILLAINALKNLSLARSLAEPNLVTMNGRVASFLAGGEFPVPVVTGATAVGLQGVSFIPFGVQLRFTPVITDRDRVRLTLNGTVSTRDNATSANIGGANVPSLNVRTFQTTVELREGQTIAIAGLIQSNLGSDATRVPFLGDIPFLGRAFASDRTSCAEQELVVLITPELVHPLERHELKPLPGTEMISPSDVEFYLCSQMLSKRGLSGTVQPASAIGDHILPTPVPALTADDPKRRQQIEEKLLIGQPGYSRR